VVNSKLCKGPEKYKKGRGSPPRLVKLQEEKRVTLMRPNFSFKRKMGNEISEKEPVPGERSKARYPLNDCSLESSGPCPPQEEIEKDFGLVSIREKRREGRGGGKVRFKGKSTTYRGGIGEGS